MHSPGLVESGCLPHHTNLAITTVDSESDRNVAGRCHVVSFFRGSIRARTIAPTLLRGPIDGADRGGGRISGTGVGRTAVVGAVGALVVGAVTVGVGASDSSR